MAFISSGICIWIPFEIGPIIVGFIMGYTSIQYPIFEAIECINEFLYYCLRYLSYIIHRCINSSNSTTTSRNNINSTQHIETGTTQCQQKIIAWIRFSKHHYCTDNQNWTKFSVLLHPTKTIPDYLEQYKQKTDRSTERRTKYCLKRIV